jgi:hypothetical protein
MRERGAGMGKGLELSMRGVSGLGGRMLMETVEPGGEAA